MMSENLDDVKKMVKDSMCDSELETYKKKVKLATPTYIIDPSGFAYQGVASDRVEGVTAIIYTAPTSDPAGPWVEWDAAAYGQTSPQLTDAEGRYGWDVNKGWYKIVYSKPGYQTVESEIFHILPERLDLDVDMLATAAPQLTGASVSGEAPREPIVLTFDQWMQTESVSAAVQVFDADGARIAGTIAAQDAEDSPDGVSLAKAFIFTPESDWAPPAQVTVVISGEATSYAEVTLGQDVTRVLAVGMADGDEDPGSTENPAHTGGDNGTDGDLSRTGGDANLAALLGIGMLLLVTGSVLRHRGRQRTR